MSATKILRCYASLIGRRFINQSAKRLESKAPDGVNKTSSSTSNSTSTGSSHSESIIGPRMMIPNDFEKWILVWTKRYPKGQVPHKIKEEVMYQTKNKARIKAANYMMVITILGCIAAVISGKKAAKSGDTVQKRNLDWHKKLKEEHEAEMQQTKS